MTTGQIPGPLFPANVSRVWVVGTFIDLQGNPLKGSISFAPSPQLLLDRVPRLIIGAATFSASLDKATGGFAVQLPATDDPDIVPTGFTYRVVEPTGRGYDIVVPQATPLLDQPGHPLHGQPVIDLIDIVPAAAPNSGTVQLVRGDPGRGVTSASIDGNGYLVLGYSDGTGGPVGFVGGSGAGGGPRGFHHEQPVPDTAWTITHLLGFNPAGIVARDATGLIEPADVAYPDTNTCVLSWSAATAGSADLS